MNEMTSLKFFVLLYLVSLVLIYVLNQKTGVPLVLPGDIYKVKGTRRIYIPLATSFTLALILFLVLNKYIK
ncbi:hypothetical protein A2686_04050 [Candidatus Woesebacteria bacterium RIFCSPHIGHO2_01_FULL_38_10]|uniref:DUF2905 domain-containing protein n=1 Tax=Candidatus Woesebacteria bacterium RIFCSPLOWO2_01_FULL_39_10b TaxID=1802517 RepID=A0A1F8B5Z5_9BACT|nr:MAG: hypothetical protein A2686_04050 [Candidatus Woesebacteria bacterium RIFCSPHIGHO2_01_FULL_38_10]OGM59464.1 MAG: hypothetical protein A2892_02345 [Candidatus Woesebacteria bacterium RIFCSPLOWO2_01_FULL_39_10b]